MHLANLLDIPDTKKSLLENLLSRPMTRREFLLYGGMVMITITGITGIVNAIVSPHRSIFDKKYPKQTVGYGSSSYGGVEKKG